MVAFLPKIHAITKENVSKDKLTLMTPPEHFVTWQHKMRRVLVDIKRRFIVAVDGDVLAGIFFYRYGDEGKIFIEDAQTAWAYRNNPRVMDGFLKKLEYDKATKDATFYASERIKIAADQEMLAKRGATLITHEDGWEKLGTFAEMATAIKLRYNRGTSSG